MIFDQLAFQLELDNGNRFMHLLIQLQIFCIISTVILDFKGIAISCGSCCRSCTGSYGTGGIYTPTHLSYNCKVGGPSGGYIFSTVNKDLASKIGINNWLGVSSWAIDMSISKEEYKDIPNFDNSINYTADKNDPIYKGYKKNYVSYDDSMRQLLGYENTPEFYAILPLIKI